MLIHGAVADATVVATVAATDVATVAATVVATVAVTAETYQHNIDSCSNRR